MSLPLQVSTGLDWMDDAQCARVDTELFYPDHGQNATDAKAVCGRCYVREECLTYANAARETHGVWGGLTERERRNVDPDRVFPCGVCEMRFFTTHARARHLWTIHREETT